MYAYIYTYLYLCICVCVRFPTKTHTPASCSFLPHKFYSNKSLKIVQCTRTSLSKSLHLKSVYGSSCYLFQNRWAKLHIQFSPQIIFKKLRVNELPCTFINTWNCEFSNLTKPLCFILLEKRHSDVCKMTLKFLNL